MKGIGVCKVLLAEIIDNLEMGWKECNQSLSRISEEVAVHFRQDFVSIWGSDGDLDGGGGGDDGDGDGDGDGCDMMVKVVMMMIFCCRQ